MKNFLFLMCCLGVVVSAGFIMKKKWTSEYHNYSCNGNFLGDMLFNAGETLTPYEPNSIYSSPKKFKDNTYWKSYVKDTLIVTPEESAVALTKGDSAVLAGKVRFRKIKVDYRNEGKKPTWFTVVDSTGSNVVSFRYSDVRRFCMDVCEDLPEEFIRK